MSSTKRWLKPKLLLIVHLVAAFSNKLYSVITHLSDHHLQGHARDEGEAETEVRVPVDEISLIARVM